MDSGGSGPAQLGEIEHLAGFGTWHLDVRTQALKWSDGMFAVLGLDARRGTPSYSQIEQFLTADSAKRITAMMRQAIDEGTSFELEVETIRRDRSHGWLHARGEAVRDAQGVVTILRGTVFDITERKRAQDALRRSEERLRQILEHSAQVFYSHTPDNEFLYVSPQIATLLDCPIDELPDTWTEFLTDHPINEAGLDFTRRAIETAQPQGPYQLDLKTKRGRVVRVEVHESPVVVDGKTVAIVGALTDITDRMRDQDALQARAKQQMLVAALGQRALTESDVARVLTAAAADVAEGLDVSYSMVVLQEPDTDAFVLEAGTGWNPGWVGASLGTARDCPYTAYVLTSHEPVIVDDFRTERRFTRSGILIEHGIVSGISVLIGGVDAPLGVLSAHAPESRKFTAEDVVFLQGIANTLSAAIERARVHGQLAHMAHHDTLTSLPNRLLLTDRLEMSLARAQRAGNLLALMFIDIDHFKSVNDVFGHAIGDQVLREVAARLARCVRSADTISRQGGDEFLILLPDISAEQDAARIAQKLMAALVEPFRLEGLEVVLSGSIGIACFPQNGDDAESLMRNADAAMYAAKEQGRNRYQFYSAEMNARATERLVLEGDLRHAIDQGQLFVVYQPQVDLATRAIIGVEALVRWRHPARGLVPPTRFIPIAEECGLIGQIGEWVLETACRQFAEWVADGVITGTVAVNVSAHQLRQPDFVDTVASTLARSGLDARHVEIEVTESVVMHDVEEVYRKLQGLHALGVSIAIDDFGTGYSSLSYLKQFPIHRLKIDRSFVSGLPGDRESSAIAQAIISLGRSLGLNVLAEGTETAAQDEHLRALSCNAAQGYLYAKPMPADECGHFLTTGI